MSAAPPGVDLARLRPEALPAALRAVLEALARAGIEAVVVGGCVRDLLRGVPPADWDVAADAPPARLVELFVDAVPTGIAHGTITVLGGEAARVELPEGVEVTSYRGEGAYLDGRHPSEVRFGVPLREDLARRDFTVNALAWDPGRGPGGLIDPFGGVADLEAGILRTVGGASLRFGEDGLRTMRAARFAATLGLALEERTRAALPGARPVLARVAWERRRDELEKLLLAPRPSVGLRVLEEAFLLEEVVPELRESVRVEQNRWHGLDVWEHTLAVVDAAPARRLVRWAALLHDVAKPRCRRMGEAGDWTFYEHEVVGERMTLAILDRLRASHALRDEVAALVRHHLVRYDSTWSDAAVRRLLARVGRERLPDLLELAAADVAGKGLPAVEAEQRALLAELRGRVDEAARRGAALSVRELALGGREVMAALGRGPGPHVGRALRLLLDAVVEDPAKNTREALLAELARRAGDV